MAQKTILADEVFQVPAAHFAIGPSAQGYTLNFSADGENFTAWDSATDANTNEVVCNAPLSLFFKLVGNTDTVIINY